MAEPISDDGGGGGDTAAAAAAACGEQTPPAMEGAGPTNRKEKRKAAKKMKRKQLRKEAAAREREEEEARMNDPEERRRAEVAEKEEEERRERERKEFEERERAWVEAMERKRKKEEEEEEAAEAEERARALEESRRQQDEDEEHNRDDGDDWEYVEEEGPAEIIWQGNEIIVKKKTIRVPKKGSDTQMSKEDADRPTSNPLPPQSEAYSDYKNASTLSAQQVLENVALQVPNFGTEQDKAHCPFHLKTGACRFGQRCSRVHFYPDKSCTLLIKNMYNGPGLAWEQDEGLEYTDEEVERAFEEFYEDVHTEFLKFGEIVNFKVCKNGSFHLRGNVYVHYKSMDSAVLAYNSINGRFFAGKQVTCEFVNLMRWRVAICGDYMKSRFKTCSHGTACNFIHCFRNPGGDYEWADWDKSPPKYWVSKMAALFGYSLENYQEEEKRPANVGRWRNSSKSFDSRRGRTRRSSSREKDYLSSRRSEESHATHQERDEEEMKFNDEKEKMNVKNHHRSHRRNPRDEDGHRLAVDTDKERWHGNARRSSRHWNDSVSPDENRDIKRTRYRVESDGSKSEMDEDEEARRAPSRDIKRTRYLVESDGSKSDTDEDEEARRARPRRHTKRHKTIKHVDRSGKTHDTDFSLHRSSRDGHDGYSKHRSSKHRKRSRSSDNDSMSHNIQDRWDPE
ncbi:zinc finger CCCH domain-containing protein 5 [Eucalyptus grandis]|uniref:zinc finger CCCH domain-containing protein 5 n=1 Tax=Eucalyptus grandis TaxID=71139 RepID=UPI00192E94B1|nr:zinc finger CCCH domain-containing protein 5 [Eucalyptus grandis]